MVRVELLERADGQQLLAARSLLPETASRRR